MEFKKSKIADIKQKIIVNNDNEMKAKGYKIFPIVYSNVFLLGKKFSGKTTTISTILKEVSGKNTNFIFIGSTVNKDKSYKEITKYYEDKGHNVEIYDDLIVDEDGELYNVLDRFIEIQKSEAKDSNQQGEGKITQMVMQPSIIELPSGMKCLSYTHKVDLISPLKPHNKVDIKPQISKDNDSKQSGGNIQSTKKVKYVYPLYIIVIDDMGSAMRNKYLTQLLKTNRHYKTMVIMSGQNITDLEPSALRQVDYTLVYGRQPDDKIFKLHDDLDIEISKEQLLELYKDATSEPFSFLYIGRTPRGDEFRQGFNNKYDF